MNAELKAKLDAGQAAAQKAIDEAKAKGSELKQAIANRKARFNDLNQKLADAKAKAAAAKANRQQS